MIVQNIKTFYQKFPKIINLSLLGIVSVIVLSNVISLMTAKTFYYIDKDSGRLIEERKHIKNIKPHSSIQNLLREYLDGSLQYRGHLPFNHVTQLLNVNHNAKKELLVLNWDVYFATAMASSHFDEDIYFLLKTIHANTSVEKVYFLMNGNQTPIYWRQRDLSKGISLENFK
ncbi:MAG: GerMN domain-containing protein [Brevinema sp.]